MIDKNYQLESNQNSIVKITILDLTILSAIVVGTTFLYLFSPITQEEPVRFYIGMAERPFSFMEYPYGTRILSPLIAHYLPFEPLNAYRWIDYFAFTLTGILIYILSNSLTANRLVSAVMVIVFWMAPTVQFMITHPSYIDPMSYWLMLFTFVSMLIGSTGMVAGSLSLNALNRPETIALLPVYYACSFSRKNWKVFLKNALLCAVVPIGVAFCMHWFWPKVSDFSFYSELYGEGLYKAELSLRDVFERRGFSALISPLLYRELMPYIWGFATVGLLAASARIRIISVMHIILSILPMIIALDFYRIPFYAFPGLLILAAIGMNTLFVKHLLPTMALTGLILLHGFFYPMLMWPVLIEVLVCLWLYFSHDTKSKD